jgi:hypothetical protein
MSASCPERGAERDADNERCIGQCERLPELRQGKRKHHSAKEGGVKERCPCVFIASDKACCQSIGRVTDGRCERQQGKGREHLRARTNNKKRSNEGGRDGEGASEAEALAEKNCCAKRDEDRVGGHDGSGFGQPDIGNAKEEEACGAKQED